MWTCERVRSSQIPASGWSHSRAARWPRRSSSSKRRQPPGCSNRRSKKEWAEAEKKADYKLGALAVGVRKECDDLRQAINQALAEMEKDGTRKAILTKYQIWNDQQANMKK